MKSFLFLILFFSSFAQSKIMIAFVEIQDSSGKVVQLEPDGKFAHIALSFQEKWLHSHPRRGVEIVEQVELEKIGRIAKVIEYQSSRSLTLSEVADFLGRPYDSEFSWANDKIYCAELVAKILNIDPVPMTFSSAFWSEHYKVLKGEVGLSPDDIYAHLLSIGYIAKKISRSCNVLLKN